MLAIVAGAGLLLPPAGLLPALLRIEGRIAYLVAGLILAQTEIVLVLTGMSFWHSMTRAGILLAELGLALACTIAWLRLGRPAVLLGGGYWRKLRGGASQHPLVALLVVGSAGALAFQVFMGLVVAPQEYDSLVYHLPRAAYWVQQHTVLQSTDGLRGDPRVVAAPNAELLGAWTMALSRGDHFVAMVQALAVLGLGGLIFAGARLIGFGAGAACFAGALFVVLPETILQAATPQNDALVSFFIAAAALFGVRAVRARSAGEAAVAAAAAGLAIGTKGSVAFAAPALLILWGAAVVRWRPPLRWLVVCGSLLLAAVVALGSLVYIENEVHFASPSGGLESSVGGNFATEGNSSNPVVTMARLGWVFMDASGVPVDASGSPTLPLVPTIERRLAPLRDRIFAGSRKGGPDPPLKIDVADDDSAYGLVGLLVLWPTVLFSALGWRRRRDRQLLALASLSYFLAFALSVGYSHQAARLLMPFVALGAPLLAGVAHRRILLPVTVVVALANVFPCLVLNQTKALLQPGEPSILARDRLAQQLNFDDLIPMQGAIRRLDRLLPDTAPLGFVAQTTPRLRALDYTLLGAHLQRRVVELDGSQVTRAQLQGRGLAGVVLWDPKLPVVCPKQACLLSTAGLRAAGLRETRLGYTAVLLQAAAA